jgi:hypothetical protein
MNSVDLVSLIPAALLIGFFVGAWLWRREGGCVLPAVVPMITANEISERIAQVVRNIVTSVFEVLTPVIDILGIAQIVIGLLLALGLRQEFLGWRLIVSGGIMLIFVHVIAPFLLSFI